MNYDVALFSCHCGSQALNRCADCGTFLCSYHSIYSDGQTICSSGCKEAERLHRLGHEEICYARLTEQIRAAIANFIPRMNAAGNPGAMRIGQPAVRVKSRLFSREPVTKEYPRGPLGWRRIDRRPRGRRGVPGHRPRQHRPRHHRASLVDLTTREE